MSTISLREKRLAVITVLIILYAIVGFTARKRLDAWRASRVTAKTAATELQNRRELIAADDAWRQRYHEMSNLMPVFSIADKVDTHWLKIMDDAATKSDIIIGARKVTRETLVGDVYEMAIECNEWRGSTSALVKFLYELQKAGVMLDIRSLVVRPDSKNPANLTGRFTLFCAYMREAPPAGGTTP